MNTSTALLASDKRENIEAISENVKPAIARPYTPGDGVFRLTPLNKNLGGSFLSERRRVAVTALKRNRNFRTLLEVAEGYFVKGVLPQAQSYYKQALAINPKLHIAYQRLKSIALRRKDLASLEENQRLLVENSDRRSDFLHEYAIMRIALHPQDKVVVESVLNDLNEAVQKEPSNARYLNSRGFVLLNFFQGKQTDQAEQDFRHAVSLDPEQVDANNNLGVALMRKGESQVAIEYFEKCIAKSPKYQFSYQNLCICYKNIEKFPEAIAVLDRASAAGIVLPHSFEHLYGWLLIQAGELVAAQSWYKNKVLEEPNNNLLYNNLGVCFLELGDSENAIINFDKAIRLVKSKSSRRISVNRLDLQAFYNKGRASLIAGDRKTAEAIRADLIKMNPHDAYALYVEANSYLVAGDLQKALDAYQRSIAADPFLPDPYPDVAFILECHVQDYQVTIELLEGAVGRGIRTPLVLNNLAYAYIRAGELDKAERTLESQVHSKRPEFFATKGMLSLHRMNLEEGDRLYMLAIERLKDHEKPMAIQLWHYERAIYFEKKGDQKESLREAVLAKEVRSSYLNKNIQAVIDRLTNQAES